MKVALCISGKLGDWDQCADSILQNIITPLRPDIFLATWDDEDYQNFVQFYKPKKWITFNFKEKKKALNNLIFDVIQQPSAGLVPMLYNIHACNNLRVQHEHTTKTNYDLIIRMRPDVMVLEQIKIHEIRDCIKNNLIRLPYFESTNIYAPRSHQRS